MNISCIEDSNSKVKDVTKLPIHVLEICTPVTFSLSVT